MGTFHTGCTVENHVDRSKFVRLQKVLVDTGSEYTWIPETKLQQIGVKREKKDLRFALANGEVVTRSVGFAILRVGKNFTIDEVVFAERGDLLLLGARTLEGLNLTVDSARKKLVAAGPLPAAYSLPAIREQRSAISNKKQSAKKEGLRKDAKRAKIIKNIAQIRAVSFAQSSSPDWAKRISSAYSALRPIDKLRVVRLLEPQAQGPEPSRGTSLRLTALNALRSAPCALLFPSLRTSAFMFLKGLLEDAMLLARS